MLLLTAASGEINQALAIDCGGDDANQAAAVRRIEWHLYAPAYEPSLRACSERCLIA